MKKILSLFFLIFFYMSSCDEKIVTLSITQDSPIRIDQTRQSVTLEIMSNSIWNILSDYSWCVVPQGQGTGNRSVLLAISINSEKTERVAIVTVSIPDVKTVSVKIIQSGSSSPPSIIPIVFHILYNDSTNQYHNVRQGRIGEIVAGTNKLLNDNGVNITVQLVSHTPSGVQLHELGVNRVSDWARPIMDYTTFMTPQNQPSSENL